MYLRNLSLYVYYLISKLQKLRVFLYNWARTRCDSDYLSLGLIDKGDLEHCSFTPGRWRYEPKSSELIQLQPVFQRFHDRNAQKT